MARGSVLVIGGALEDLSLTVPAQIRRGQLTLPATEKLIAHPVVRSVGGGAVTLSVALATLGHHVTTVAAVGDDEPGRWIAAELRKAGATAALARTTEPTGTSAILRVPGRPRDHWILEDRGANDLLAWKHVQPYLRRTPALLVLSHLSGRAHALLPVIARELPEQTALVWSPGTTQIARGVGSARSLLRKTALLVLNRDEMVEWFGGRRDRAAQHRAIEGLLAAGAKSVVVTAGAQGATAYWRNARSTVARTASAHAASLVTRTVDTVGAGDAFVAGCASSWSQTPDLQRAVYAGALSAAATIGVLGALGGLLTQRELQRGLARFPLAVRS